MNFDLRLPLGLLFSLFGAMLVSCGLISGARSLGLNLNLWWGAVLLLFGVSMLRLALRARAKR
jgi:hypothetical protein